MVRPRRRALAYDGPHLRPTRAEDREEDLTRRATLSTLVAMADMVVAREEGDGARTELVIRIPDGVWDDPLPGHRVRVIDVRYVPPQREPSD